MREFYSTECILIRIYFDNKKEKGEFVRFLIEENIAQLANTQEETSLYWFAGYSEENALKIEEYLRGIEMVER